MDINKIKKIINDEKTIVRLHLVHWTSGGNIIALCPTIEDEFAKQLKQITSVQLDHVGKLTTSQYNVVGANSDVLETIDKKDPNYKDYNKKIQKVLNSLGTKPKKDIELKNDNFDFFIYEFFTSNDENVYAFRRTKKLKSFKKGFIGHVIDGHFKKLKDKDLLGTDDVIDLILYNGEVAILKHISFERIFHLSNEFFNHAVKVLNRVELAKKIDNFEALRNDALNNANCIKRLSKLDVENNSTATLFLEHLSSTKKVIDTFGFEIDVDLEKGIIKYKDVSQLGNFINFMQDAYYKTIIGAKKGVDERR